MITTFLKLLIVIPLTAVCSLSAIVAAFIDRSGGWFHAIGRFWSRVLLRLFGITVAAYGYEKLDHGKRYIYVSNHASMFDIPAVMVGIPDQFRIVLKKELTRIPLFGWAMSLGPYIVIDRFHAKDAIKSLDEAAERIRNGASVLLFAEGTRTTDGKLQPFKRGAFTLAVKSGVPVVPVTINNTFRILPKGSKRVRPTHIEVILDEPIETKSLEGREGEKQLMDLVHRAIAKNYKDQS